MRVSNINGTTDRACNCGSWFAHWRKLSGQSLSLCCPMQSCIEPPEVGAHVQKDGSRDRNWYIVPLCKTHNRETGKSLDIDSRVKLVSANVSGTCGGYQ
jgi:hypothetical protein